MEGIAAARIRVCSVVPDDRGGSSVKEELELVRSWNEGGAGAQGSGTF